MKFAKFAIVFYIVFVMSFVMEHNTFALPEPAAGVDEDESEDRPATLPDYQVKSRFLTIFGENCKWPPQSSVTTPGAPFIIGAFEENDTISYLIDTVKTKTIVGKKARILIISEDGESEQCNLLYITDSSGKRLQEILEITNKLPLLTVSDVRGDAEKGVMIEMFIVKNKMHFIVNLSAARKHGLFFSSTFLKYADRIIED
ncbi:MAG: hypothetical protein QG657_5518 [Acidobacteriota bacterium]|nr:hypothetical protein [Acidobacteriota bacterium]